MPPVRDALWERCANAAPDQWAARVVDSLGTIEIHPSSERRSDRMSLAIAGGRFVAIDSGEFGGGLTWVPALGAPQRLVDGSIPQVARGDDAVYALHDAAMLGRSELLRLRAAPPGRWVIDTVAVLPFGANLLAVLPHDTLLVVGYGGVVLLTSSGRMVRTHGNAVWAGTAPQSVVRDRAGVLYVGMRSAVARLVPAGDGYRERWLVETRCRRRAFTDQGRCACVDE